MSYWDIVRPTYIESWPAALHTLSIPSVDIPLTTDDAKRLGSNIVDLGEVFLLTPEEEQQNSQASRYINACTVAQLTGKPIPGDVPAAKPVTAKRLPNFIGDIRSRVAKAVASMPDGAFVRLGSRSPKDSWEGMRRGSLKVTVDDDPMVFLLDASERVCEDLELAIANQYLPHIFVRQWLDIPRWAEFRCFMRDRHLVGISQYHYLDGEVFPEVVSNADVIRWAIGHFFARFREASHLESVVFDVFLRRRTHRTNIHEWECRLLEINPFFELTDPCLFAWSQPFDGGFRYNRGA